MKILELINLNYGDFKDINISFNSGTFYSIVGGSNSGKTTLFKLISSLIPTRNAIICNNVSLNDNNYFNYLLNIGIVERVNKKSFIFNNVIDEMKYPLNNLGFSKRKTMERIIEIVDLFKARDYLNKRISNLDYYERQKLLIMIALLHQPKVLLLDSVLDFFPKDLREEIVKVLRKYVKNGNIVLNFTKCLGNADKYILIDKFKIIGEYLPKEIYLDDKLFYSHNLEIPFITDLSVKLKMYDIVDKEYHSMKAMVDDIWP